MIHHSSHKLKLYEISIHISINIDKITMPQILYSMLMK